MATPIKYHSILADKVIHFNIGDISQVGIQNTYNERSSTMSIWKKLRNNTILKDNKDYPFNRQQPGVVGAT